MTSRRSMTPRSMLSNLLPLPMALSISDAPPPTNTVTVSVPTR